MVLKSRYCVPNLNGRLKRSFGARPLSVTAPGSKSITNRALLMAAMAEGTSLLQGALFSEDTRCFLECIQTLGFHTTVSEAEKTIAVQGLGGPLPCAFARQYVGGAGTAARFLTAYLGLSHGVFFMDASKQMRKRPMEPLLDALEKLGCQFFYRPQDTPGHFPFFLRGHGVRRDRITVDIDRSSQFLSALLIVSCLSPRDFTTQIKGSHGMAYIRMTIRMMEQFGVCVEQPAPDTFLTRAGQRYVPRTYPIEPDVSAACYFYALSPLLGIPVLVNGIHYDSLQGDIAFIKILERMGCGAKDTRDGIVLSPPADGIFHGVHADMSACSDQAITLAAIAPYAAEPTTIAGIGHIRCQESDRIQAIVTELSRMGIRCSCREESVTVYPGYPRPACVETYEDHRMAMGFALTGLKSDGIVIKNPACCKKTFPAYFQTLDQVVKELT